MTKLVFIAIWILAMPYNSLAFNEECEEATRSVEIYYSALREADESQLQNLLTGRLRQQQNTLFQNPYYRDHLLNFYAEFSYEVLSCGYTGSNVLQVSVTEQYGQHDQINKYLSVDVEQGYRIVGVSLVADEF